MCAYTNYSVMALPMNIAKMVHGEHPYMDEFPEAASQSFVKGDLVCLASGYLTKCGSDPAAVLGVALADAHNGSAGAYMIPVLVLTTHMVLTMQVYHGTPSSSVIAAADLGTAYGIVDAGSGVWKVDKTDTSNTRVKVVTFLEPVGTAAGKVGVVFLPANLQMP